MLSKVWLAGNKEVLMNILETIFLASSISFGFLSIMYFFKEKIIGVLAELIKIKRIKRRVTKYEKQKRKKNRSN